MEVNEVKFVGSYTKNEQCPKDMVPEYAFIGRSNVGKSSLVNALTGRNSIARVSKQPGKTQTLNFFKINDEWHLVDLPGYGYAKVSKQMRKSWDQMIMSYLSKRPQLVMACVLIDARIPPQKNDLEFMNRLGRKKIPFIIVFTKTDKLKSNRKAQLKSVFQKAMKSEWAELPETFQTSSLNGDGIESLLEYIAGLNSKLLSGQ